MDPDRLLDGLNEAQRRAVTSSVVPLCILAGAGSGKTRVLTHRIAYRAATDQHDPRRVLALTFTRKAAGEMTARLRRLGLRDSVAAGTFHAVAYAQLRVRWAERNINPPTLLDRKVPLVAKLLPSARSSRGSSSRAGGSQTRDVLPLDVVTEIEWAKARCVSPDQYPSAAKAGRRTPPLEPREIASLYQRYEDEKRSRRMVDFDDLLSLCARDLRRDPDFATTQRWRYRHFFVDEYQDVNPLQQSLLDAWLGDRTDLCVVGDPNQAIYAWNGANARYLTEFTTHWERGEVVRLSENYRSSPEVLAVANAVLAGSLSARRAAERGDDVGALRANRPSGPIPSIRSYPDDRDEARGIARAIRDHHRPGSSWSAQAILVRTNAQTTVIEDALRKAQIPFRVKGGTSLLDQPEVKAAVRDLRGLRGDLAPALRDLETLASRGDGADPDGDGGPGDRGAPPEADSRQANLQALVRLGYDYTAMDASATTQGFLTWLTETNRSDQPDAWGDAVDITTFHAAKGLEWPIVHLAGLEQGLVPIGHAQTPAELAEERRLFYVAVTRAEHQLFCSWAESRTFGTRLARRDRSPYLAQAEAACEVLATDAVPDNWAAFLQARADSDGQGSFELDPPRRTPIQRLGPGPAAGHVSGGRAGGALSMLTAADRTLFDALASWRAVIARAADVAPDVLIDDVVLGAIASARPRTADELVAAGVGPVKAHRYGDAILAVVAAH